MNCQTALTKRRKRAGWITLDINIPQIIDAYAEKYLRGMCDHETKESYAAQCAADLRMPQAKRVC